MIALYHSNARSRELSEIENPKNGSWVHVVAPDEDELTVISEQYELDRDLLGDAIDLYEAPRVERSEDGVYVFTRYYHPDNGVINATEPLLIVYKPNLLVTVQRVKSAILELYTSKQELIVTTQKTKTLLQMLAAVNGSYRQYVNKVTKNILRARSQLKQTDISNEVLLGFVGMEDDLNEFLSALEPQAAMLRNLLGGRYIRLYEEDRDMVEDLMLSTTELIDLVNSRLKTIITIREAYDAIATSELNRTFRRLTSISIFLMVPTIVSGLYGMNVPLPYADNPRAFLFVLALIIITNGLMILGFRRKRWL